MVTPTFSSAMLHDNLIHGITLPYLDSMESTLSFDIDHILKCVHCSPNTGESIFLVSKALLSFHHVTDLTLNITWENSHYSHSEQGLFIIEAQREKVDTVLRLNEYYKWNIITNEKNYVISFGAASMSLELIGEPKRVNRQHLLKHERI